VICIHESEDQRISTHLLLTSLQEQKLQLEHSLNFQISDCLIATVLLALVRHSFATLLCGSRCCAFIWRLVQASKTSSRSA